MRVTGDTDRATVIDLRDARERQALRVAYLDRQAGTTGDTQKNP